jgi:hypothetical protein
MAMAPPSEPQDLSTRCPQGVCEFCGVACAVCARHAWRLKLWAQVPKASLQHILDVWASVSVGLTGRDRLADFAARVLDGREACCDWGAFRAGLLYLQPRKLWFCSRIQGSRGGPLPYRRSMLLVLRAWARVCPARPKLQLVDWWLNRMLYDVLPNRIYFFLGANHAYSVGEGEWYALLNILRLRSHWCHGA